MEQVNTTTVSAAHPTAPTYRMTDADYVMMIDEIIDSIDKRYKRYYGSFIDGKAYWFDLDYVTGEDCELVIRLSGHVIVARDYYRGGNDGPGYDNRTGKIVLKRHECRHVCDDGNFDSWPPAECGFDPRQIDNYEYDLSEYEVEFDSDFND